ncbi:MAG TPA: hypothetical protein PKY87_08120, partial [Terricaulis sp.]|nr:hypothetical protein [Terricaulis sp.]
AMPVLLRAHKWPAFVIAVIVAVVTGLVSLAGAHLAWAVLSGQPDELPGWDAVHAAGLALAFVKPAQSFVIAEWALLAGDDLKAAEVADAQRQHDLARLREQHLHEQAMARIGAQAAEPIAAEPAPMAAPAPRSEA